MNDNEVSFFHGAYAQLFLIPCPSIFELTPPAFDETEVHTWLISLFDVYRSSYRSPMLYMPDYSQDCSIGIHLHKYCGAMRIAFSKYSGLDQ